MLHAASSTDDFVCDVESFNRGSNAPFKVRCNNPLNLQSTSTIDGFIKNDIIPVGVKFSYTHPSSGQDTIIFLSNDQNQKLNDFLNSVGQKFSIKTLYDIHLEGKSSTPIYKNESGTERVVFPIGNRIGIQNELMRQKISCFKNQEPKISNLYDALAVILSMPGCPNTTRVRAVQKGLLREISLDTCTISVNDVRGISSGELEFTIDGKKILTVPYVAEAHNGGHLNPMSKDDWIIQLKKQPAIRKLCKMEACQFVGNPIVDSKVCNHYIKCESDDREFNATAFKVKEISCPKRSTGECASRVEDCRDVKNSNSVPFPRSTNSNNNQGV